MNQKQKHHAKVSKSTAESPDVCSSIARFVTKSWSPIACLVEELIFGDTGWFQRHSGHCTACLLPPFCVWRLKRFTDMLEICGLKDHSHGSAMWSGWKNCSVNLTSTSAILSFGLPFQVMQAPFHFDIYNSWLSQGFISLLSLGRHGFKADLVLFQC